MRISLPYPYSFLFALLFGWSHNTSADKKSNPVGIFAKLYYTLGCGSNFLQLGSIFYRNAQKKEEKKYQLLEKLATHFSHFQCNTPHPRTLSNEDFYLFCLPTLINPTTPTISTPRSS